MMFGFCIIPLKDFRRKKKFEEISEVANYEWSLIELKLPENFKFLYGLDIRNKLSDIENIEFDYNDILARALYHLEICLKQLTSRKEKNIAMKFPYWLFVLDISHLQKFCGKILKLKHGL